MYFLDGTSSVFLGALMPEVLAHYHTTYAIGGLLALLGSVGFIIGVPITANGMKRWDYRLILSSAALAVTIAQLGVLFLPPLLWLGIFILLNGMGAAALETAVASYIMEAFSERRAILLSKLEVAFGVGALSLPILSSIFIKLHLWRLTSLFIATTALILAVSWPFISGALQAAPGFSSMAQKDAKTAAPPIFTSKISRFSVLASFLLMILVYVGIEGGLNNFLPSLFAVDLNIQPYVASLSSSVFWGAMVLGRLAMGWIVRHIPYERYLLYSILLGMLFFLGLIIFRTPLLAFISLFIVGLSLSAIYSLTMVYANHTFPGKQRTVTSYVTAFAGLGAALFPAILGYAMDYLRLNQVLWLIWGFMAVLLFLFFALSFNLYMIRQRYLLR